MTRMHMTGSSRRLLLGTLLLLLVVGISSYPHTSLRPTTSDRFWALLQIDGVQHKWFASLQEMTTEASVVVVGHITTVERGRVFAPEPQHGARDSVHYLDAHLIIDEILHGAPQDPTASGLILELFAPTVDAIPHAIQAAPTERAIFFLLNKAVHPATAVLPPDARAAEAKYYEIIGSQAVLTEVQGRVHVRRDVPLGAFPQGIEGSSFEAVADTIRQYP